MFFQGQRKHVVSFLSSNIYVAYTKMIIFTQKEFEYLFRNFRTAGFFYNCLAIRGMFTNSWLDHEGWRYKDHSMQYANRPTTSQYKNI